LAGREAGPPLTGGALDPGRFVHGTVSRRRPGTEGAARSSAPHSIVVASGRWSLNPPAMPSEFAITRTVEFAETDMAGIMHFSNYFYWMEACETAFYRSLGLPLISFVPGEVVGWPRVKVNCQYRAPLRFNDAAEVRLFVGKIGAKSLSYVFQFRKEAQLVAQGEVTVVCVSADPKAPGGMVAQPIPADIRAMLQEAPASAYA
jgi:YbgC/YbaW family acyl-CoA thioester hydrolase